MSEASGVSAVGNRAPRDKHTLSAAKQRLVALLSKDREERARPIVARGEDQPSELSFGQRRLWFLHRRSPESTAYNEFVRLHLEGQLDVEAFRESLAAVVRRHAVLRTTFRETGSGPVQVVDSNLVPVLQFYDLSTLSRDARARSLDVLQRCELKMPFDLAAGPIVRARLVRLNAGEHELLFSVHHIACDAWSFGIFVRELGAAYAAIVNGEPPSLPQIEIQYTDYARWQSEAAGTPSATAQLEYWRRQLPEPAPVLELPFARPRPDVRTASGITASFTLSADLAVSVRRLAGEEHATPFMVLLAAFHSLLHRYTGENDIRVGTPVAGRTRIEAEPLIGFFVNTLVMRGDVSGEPSFRELLRRTRAIGLAAYANQDVPFDHLVEALRTKCDLSHTPLFQALFVLQNAPVGELTLPGLTITPIEVDRGTSKFDVALSMTETADGFKGSFECSADLFDAASVARMAAHYAELLASAVDTPDERVSALRLLSTAERHDLVVDQTDTRVFDSAEPVHGAFARQAASRPGDIAPELVFMFPGQGSQYVRMGADLYGDAPTFRKEVDACADLLRAHLGGQDIRRLLWPAVGTETARARELLDDTQYTQPAIFVTEYALARLFISWGLVPQILMSHSVGEYVAACLAGVFTLADALALVAARGRLIQSLPEDAMLAVLASEEALRGRLREGVALAAGNGAAQCVVAGRPDAIAVLEASLTARGIACRALRTSHAFHSPMMEPIPSRFRAELERVVLRPPAIRCLSSVTGTWLTDADATDPDYWVRHLRETVRFSDGLMLLADGMPRMLVEVGPGRALTRLARRAFESGAAPTIVPSMRDENDTESDVTVVMSALAEMWMSGAAVDWDQAQPR
jgi:malonyl CoA-acyl carrier protein transacylase